MLKNLLLVVVIGAVLVFRTTLTSAAAQSRDAFREQQAFLSFTAVAPLVCADNSSSSLTTDLSISLTTRAERGERSRTTEARAEIVRRNGCTGEFQETFPVVPEPSAQISGADSATLEVSFELIEFSTGQPLGLLDVALVWAGTAEPTRRRESATRCSGSLTTRTRSRIESRTASLQGVVSLNGVDLLAGVEYSAVLVDTRTNEVTLPTKRCVCSSSEDADVDSADDQLSGAAASVTRTALDSNSAIVSLQNVTPLVCADGTSGELDTSAVVTAAERVFRSNSDTSSSSEVVAFLTRVDGCTGEVVNGSATIAPPDYVQRGTASASLNASFELADQGTSVGVLETALVLTGTGDPSCESSFSITCNPPGVFGSGAVTVIDRTEHESRAASVSGIASFERLELVNDVDLAQLDTFRQSTVIIEH